MILLMYEFKFERQIYIRQVINACGDLYNQKLPVFQFKCKKLKKMKMSSLNEEYAVLCK